MGFYKGKLIFTCIFFSLCQWLSLGHPPSLRVSKYATGHRHDHDSDVIVIVIVIVYSMDMEALNILICNTHIPP